MINENDAPTGFLAKQPNPQLVMDGCTGCWFFDNDPNVLKFGSCKDRLCHANERADKHHAIFVKV